MWMLRATHCILLIIVIYLVSFYFFVHNFIKMDSSHDQVVANSIGKVFSSTIKMNKEEKRIFFKHMQLFVLSIIN